MKYIRTKDGRLVNRSDFQGFKSHGTTGRYIVRTLVDDNDLELWLKYNSTSVIKQADTIEDLCDEFVCLENKMIFSDLEIITSSCNLKDLTIYGAIWTDKGLQFVARMNSKGELELL